MGQHEIEARRRHHDDPPVREGGGDMAYIITKGDNMKAYIIIDDGRAPVIAEEITAAMPETAVDAITVTVTGVDYTGDAKVVEKVSQRSMMVDTSAMKRVVEIAPAVQN